MKKIGDIDHQALLIFFKGLKIFARIELCLNIHRAGILEDQLQAGRSIDILQLVIVVVIEELEARINTLGPDRIESAPDLDPACLRSRIGQVGDDQSIESDRFGIRAELLEAVFCLLN